MVSHVPSGACLKYWISFPWPRIQGDASDGQAQDAHAKVGARCYTRRGPHPRESAKENGFSSGVETVARLGQRTEGVA